VRLVPHRVDYILFITIMRPISSVLKLMDVI
jgi:hypothetical protein